MKYGVKQEWSRSEVAVKEEGSTIERGKEREKWGVK